MEYREPLEITAGDTLIWTRRLIEYPASGGWVLKYALRGPAVIDITSTADGDDHLVTIPSNQDPALIQGNFSIQGYVEKTGERHTVYSGHLKVNQNLVSAVAGHDGRTHAARVIDAIEALIEGRATADQQEMVVDGDRLVKTPFEMLIKIRQRYRVELSAEKRKERRKQGRSSGRLIKYQL